MKSVNFLNPLGFYNFCEERHFNAIEFGSGVEISADDKIISVTEDGELLGVVKLNVVQNELSLIGKDGSIISSATLPLVDVIDNAYYDDDKDALVISVTLTDGTTNDIEVPFNSLLDDYAKIEDVQKNAQDIATVNENLVQAIDTINQNVSDGFNTLNAGIKGNELRIAELESKLSESGVNIEEEKKAREEADKKLQDSITTVNTNLVLAINNYNNVILPKLVKDINQAIMNETDARTKSDEAISENINSLSGLVDTKVEELNEAIKAQGDRLTKLEETLSAGTITREELETAVNTEKERAIAAEEELKALIDELSTKVDTFVNDINSKIEELINSDNEINDKINDLTEKVNTIESGSTDTINELKENISSVNTRVDKLTTNTQNMINQVNENVANSINQINQNVVDAINTINGGIDEIREDLSEETTNRETADNDINTILETKVGWTEIGTKTRGVRKAIVLENHDELLGKGTDGTKYNLAMVSKWNIADFGSNAINLNLNGKGERPTYNDTKELALISDIDGKLGELKLTQDGNIYTLTIGDKVVGEIKIPVDKFIKSVNYVKDTKELVIVFVTESGETTARIDMSDLVDTYTADNGIELSSDAVFSIKIDDTSEAFLTVGKNGLKLSGVQDAINKSIEQAISESEDKTDELLANKVDWTDISTQENPNRKSILLNNHDTILGTSVSGGTYNIAMINKWDVVDLGTSHLPINLNVPKGVRATVQEQGQSGEEANKIAYLSDVETETNRATESENAIKESIDNKIADVIGSEDDTKEANTIYGAKAYADDKESNIINSIDVKIETSLEPIEAQLNNYVTKEEASQYHNDVLNESKEYTDTQISLNSGATITESVNEAKAYTDEKVSGITTQLESQANRIVKLENDSEHYSDLFAMILDEHDSGITFDFYTKTEVNEKLDEKANKSDIPTKLPNPESLTIKYNGVQAFTYDGSSSETGNFIVNANTVPMSDVDSTTIANKIAEVESGITDATHILDTISIEKQSDLEYSLKIGDRIAGTINIPKDQFLKNVSYDSDTKNITFVFEVSSGESTTIINVSDLIDVYIAGNGLNLTNNEFSIKIDSNTQPYIEVSTEGVKIVNIDEALANKVEYSDVTTEDNPNRKAIILKNHDTILGYTTEGEACNLIMMSKWNKTDIGSTKVSVNLNGKDERPTYNDNKELALLDDVNAIEIPTVLPNPNPLTIKYNGTEAFSYDGTKAEVGNFIVNAETVPMSESDSTTISAKLNTFATKEEVDSVKSDLEQFKAPYAVDLNALISANDSDAISKAIGGIDNIRNTVKENRNIIGSINNGEVSVSIRILGNTTTLYYILDTLAGYTVNEVNIQNSDGTLSKTVVSHSMMTEEMVVDNLTTSEKTLPLSANQGKILNDTKANKTELENLATKAELNKVANSKLYYPGVKVDTQKLFALTKESTEDDIKAALQLETSSGSYTLPTAEILDDCLGKGYQLLSNWMPVSIVWNGAAYVFYIVGQNYMMKPTGLYTVALSITEDGKYSVFQAAKCEEFANVEDLNEYQKIDTLLPEDTFEIATAKVANGVKTIIDKDGLQWFITQAYEGVIGSTNALKVIAIRVKSPYVTTDTTQSSYGLVYAQFTLAEGAAANSWSSVTSNGEFISEYTVNNLIDEKLINVNNAITLLNDKVSILENKYNMILEENSESVADFVGGDTINDTTKSYSVSNANIESNSTINAKNIVLNDSTLSNNARIKVNSNNIEVNNLNISGDFPKENGNSVISLNDAEYVVFKDMTFNSNNVYNGVEIGLNSEKLPKNILFENCKFEGTFSNNAILVFGTQNNATITLSNCTFDKLSNALRLSNKSNASGVTVNIINCSVNQWEETNKEFGGFLICEDYTSDASSVDSNNLFGNGKITVNFMNLTHKGEKVIYSNASRCCGTKDENQVIYVYADNVGFVNYSEDKYPIVSFK